MLQMLSRKTAAMDLTDHASVRTAHIFTLCIILCTQIQNSFTRPKIGTFCFLNAVVSALQGVDPNDDQRVHKETHDCKKRKMEKDEESMAEMKPGWKYYCSECHKSGVDTFRIQWNEPDLSLPGGRSKSFHCYKKCKKNPEKKWKKNTLGVFIPSSVWCKTPYRFLEEINVPVGEDE